MSHQPLIILALIAITATVSGCDNQAKQEELKRLEQNLVSAENMIDAFYSFDPARLSKFLSHAQSARQSLLYYQGWAEGGNYKVLERKPCAQTKDKKISCPVTVQDDPVLALKTGFMVTDTFTLTFEGTNISNVETSSNDQPIYYEARKWVAENMPDVMSGPCRKYFNGGGPSPSDCARAMTNGYRQFMVARKEQEAMTRAFWFDVLTVLI